MDISGYDLQAATSQAHFFSLLDPRGEASDIEIGVQGYDTESVEAADREHSRKVMDQRGKKDVHDITWGRRVARAQAAIVEVKNMTLEGEAVTVDALRAMIAEKRWAWILEQIEDQAGDRRSFFKNAETT